jgi:hypothetical protein
LTIGVKKRITVMSLGVFRMSDRRITALVVIGILLLFSLAWWIGNYAKDLGNDIANVVVIVLGVALVCVLIWGGEKEDK